MDMQGCGEEEEGEMYGESNMETYITIRKIDSQWEFAFCLRELKLGLCINLEGCDGEGDGREVQEGEDIYIHLWLIRVDIWQKPKNSAKQLFNLKINTLKKKCTRAFCSS